MKRIGIIISIVTVLLLAIPSAVLADQQVVDNDLLTSGNQNIVNVSADSGAAVSTSGQLVIQYQGGNHLDAGTVVTLVANASQTTLPSGYSVASVSLTVPTPWAAGGQVASTSAVSFTAPSTPGSYSYTVKWGSTVDYGNKLTGAPALEINLTVTAPPPSDTTPPVVTAVLSPAPNSAGWNNTDVLITWSASDSESGIASGPTPDSQTASAEGAGQVFTATATNGAGLTTIGSVTVNIDKTAPSVSITGLAVVLQGTSATATVTASDALSGLAVDPSGSVALDTATPGAKTITATAVDNAGNSATESYSYTVWSINGPFAPLVKNGNGTGQFKAGSTIPVKFQLTDGTSLVSTATGTVSIGSASAPFRWDDTAQQYIANVNTGKTPATGVPVQLAVTGVGNVNLLNVNLR